MELQYFEPLTIEEAGILAKEHPKAAFLAGGTDLLVRYNRHVNQFDGLINLKTIKDIQNWCEETEDTVRLGALMKHNQAACDSVVVKYYPALVHALEQIGTNQVRNLGTLGGNICNASPCADSAAMLTALGGSVILENGNKKRKIALNEFFKGPGRTAKEPGEILTWIELPKPVQGGRKKFFQYFEKIGRRKSAEISVANMGVSVWIEDDRLKNAAIIFGSVGPTVIKVVNAEQEMEGKMIGELDEPLLEKLTEEAIRPIDDIRASADYRRQVCRALIFRMVWELKRTERK